MDPLLQQVIDGTQVNDEYSFIDADTIRDTDGTRYRLQGFDAPELSKWVGGEFKAGTAGGARTTEALQRLAAQQGFNNVKVLDEEAAFGRKTAILTNDKGESFTQRLIETGVLDPTAQTTEADINALRVAELFGDQIAKEGDDDFKQTAGEVTNYLLQDGYDKTNFKEQALTELQYVLGGSDYYSSNIAFRSPDRDIKNRANSPISEAWDTGLKSVVESGYGFASLLGHTSGIDMIAELGDQGAARAYARINENASFIADYRDVNSFSSAVEFLGTNLAMSLPYMGLTIAGAVATPLALLPAGAYAGQIWNEQNEKNATLALAGGVAQAAFDRLGLGLLVSKGAGPKQIFNQGVEALMKKGATREAAEQTLANATRVELASLAGDAAQIAKDQLKKKAIAMDLLKRTTGGVITEGSTEAIQELIGYSAAHQDGTFDWGDATDRMIAAVVAGGALGGSFGAGGSLYNTGAWADVAVRKAPADERRLSQAGRFAEQEKNLRGYVPTIQELVAENRLAPDAFDTLDSRIAEHDEKQSQRSLSDQLVDTVTSAPSLWRGATRWIFKPEIQAQSRAARVLADMFGGNLQRTFSGSNFENWKHHKIAQYKNMVELPNKFWAQMNGGKRATRKDRARISQEVYKQLQTAYDKDGNFNPDAIPDGPNKQYLIHFAKQLQKLSDQLYNDQKQFNPDLGYISNYLGRYKAFDKHSIANNKQGFVTKLVNTFGMTEAEAKKIADAITDNPEINDIEEAFSVVNGTPVPGSHKKRSLNLAEQPEFQEFMQQDIFQNMSLAAKAATRYQAYQSFVGKDGANISKLLTQMESEGIPRAQVNQIAKQMKNYLDAESGNYKRPTTEFGKTLQKVQQNFMFITMLAGLGLSTVSSLVEIALTTKGLSRQQIKDVGGLGRNLGKELWTTMGQGLKEIGNIPLGSQIVHNQSANQQKLQDLGFYEWDVGAATTTGATEIGPLKQRITELFFKANGLQGYTNMTRAMRAGFAGDFINNHLDTVRRDEGTNETQEAREALRTIGIDPDRILELQDIVATGNATEADQKFWDDQMREATFNFINEAVALPGSANRPLIYQDPRFALFTQFQGFIATFTANHIPKMWGEYVKRGTPAMKYQAFATMATMIALGFASQELKDRLKYSGRESPHLDDDEWIRRGVFSSGLFGSSERIVDTFFPIYDQSSDNVAEWVFNETTGQSPALSNAVSLGKGTGSLITGDVGKGVKSLARTTPFLAPLSDVRNSLGDWASQWNFGGE